MILIFRSRPGSRPGAGLLGKVGAWGYKGGNHSGAVAEGYSHGNGLADFLVPPVPIQWVASLGGRTVIRTRAMGQSASKVAPIIEGVFLGFWLPDPEAMFNISNGEVNLG